jgi:hypothetical protein
LPGCNQDYLYNKGYEAAWKEEGEPNFWASKAEKAGYQDGVDERIYEEGYVDGYDKNKPQFLKDDVYMEGYKEGKEARKKGY